MLPVGRQLRSTNARRAYLRVALHHALAAQSLRRIQSLQLAQVL
jgi:hypothetical protein